MPTSYTNPYGTSTPTGNTASQNFYNPYRMPTTSAANEVTPAPGELNKPPAAPPKAEGGPTPPDTTPVTSTFKSWKDKGYVNADDTVDLPWGPKVTLLEAMNLYYSNRKPTADEIPPWITTPAPMAAGVPLTKWNQLPADFRSIAQQWFQKAYANSQTQPAITNMQTNSQYY